MKVLGDSEISAIFTTSQGESPHSLILMDLFTALCEETEDDALVAAAVVHLFRNKYVKFQNDYTRERVVFV